MAAKKGGLGRGLEALFNENATESPEAVTLKLTEIEPNRDQPRKIFDEEALSELAESISKHGLIQPIVVRPLSSGSYQIIAGERRWRACRMAGLSRVPVVIKEIDDKKQYEIALVENLQRENLNPVEEAKGYRALMDMLSLTQEQAAVRVGKQRSTVANALRLLSLEEEELTALSEGKITAGHARALLSVSGDIRKEMLKAAITGASVRELERMAKIATKQNAPPMPQRSKNKFYSEVELTLKEELGRKVNIKPLGKNRGSITVEFYSDDELAEIAKNLSKRLGE